MATGNYGTLRPATVSPSDMEIWYTYSPSRDVEPTISLTKLDPNQVITTFDSPEKSNSAGTPIFNGLYNLKLPAENFSVKGFYTVVIRPKEIQGVITDCGVLAAFPEIKGIVLNANQIGVNDARSLIGYRVEYYNDKGNRIPNLFRIITSANKVEPVNVNLSNSSQKSVQYRFNNGGNLIFCTLTPSSAPNVKPNDFPEIGSPNQSIVLTNTFFDPIMLELDMVEYDIETLAYGLYGNQIKSILDGSYTIYDFQNRIYKQYNLYEVQDQFTGEPLHEVREQKTQIDFTKDFNTITNIPRA